MREVVRLLDDALARLDLDAALSLCTDDVVFIVSGEGEQAVGRDAIVQMAMDLASRSADSEFTVSGSTLDVSVHRDVAVVTSFGTAELRSPRGDRPGLPPHRNAPQGRRRMEVAGAPRL